jgi:hypothetical protein
MLERGNTREMMPEREGRREEVKRENVGVISRAF